MELPHIGEACVICNRNDYLPFRCAHCAKIVCIDHKVSHGSDCPLTQTSFDADIDNRPSAQSIRQACNYCRKITLQLELSECANCNDKHCLYHRHQEQHNCPRLAIDATARQKEEAARLQRQQVALDRLKATQTACPKGESAPVTRDTRQLDPKKQALARRVNVMRIKQSARGPPNVLDQDKLFFEVEFMHNTASTLSHESKHGKKLNIFATRNHTIGRLVDFVSYEMDLTNKNQTEDADHLVFELYNKNPPDDILDSRVSFQKYIESGLLDSGDKLVITYKKEVCAS